MDSYIYTCTDCLFNSKRVNTQDTLKQKAS